jgi:hypothetical protein
MKVKLSMFIALVGWILVIKGLGFEMNVWGFDHWILEVVKQHALCVQNASSTPNGVPIKGTTFNL